MQNAEMKTKKSNQFGLRLSKHSLHSALLFLH